MIDVNSNNDETTDNDMLRRHVVLRMSKAAVLQATNSDIKLSNFNLYPYILL